MTDNRPGKPFAEELILRQRAERKKERRRLWAETIQEHSEVFLSWPVVLTIAAMLGILFVALRLAD